MCIRDRATVDPVVMAAATVMRLQGIVAREVSATDTAVVTVGAVHAGTKNNIIPDEAELLLSIRTSDAAVRDKVLTAIERIVRAEAQASGATREPLVEPTGSAPRWSMMRPRSTGRAARWPPSSARRR